MNTDYKQIRIYDNIQAMSAQGEEWLVDKDGRVLAVFIDGSLRCEIGYINTDNVDTKVAV